MAGGRIALVAALVLGAAVGCGDRGKTAPKGDPPAPARPMDPELVAALDALATAADVAEPLAEIGRHSDPRAVTRMVQVMVERPEVAHPIRVALVSMPELAAPALLSLVATRSMDVEVRARSALLLGDLRSRPAVASLIEAADVRSPIVAEILDALRMIGDPRGAAGAERVWSVDADPLVRALALDVFSYLSNDVAKLPALAGVLGDEDESDSVRSAAQMAYGRLVYARDQLSPLLDRQAELAALYRESTGGAANSYLARQRAVAQSIARGVVGAVCGSDAPCYAQIVARPLAVLGSELGPVIPDLEAWPARERATLAIVAAERAFLELGKLGAGARDVVPAMLERASGTDPLSRQGALLVIARAAERPCDACAERLDAIAVADRGDPDLRDLREETEVVRAYLMTQP